MNKKDYQTPTMRVVNIQQKPRLLSGSLTDISTGDIGISYGGGGSGTANARAFDEWIDE